MNALFQNEFFTFSVSPNFQNGIFSWKSFFSCNFLIFMPITLCHGLMAVAVPQFLTAPYLTRFFLFHHF